MELTLGRLNLLSATALGDTAPPPFAAFESGLAPGADWPFSRSGTKLVRDHENNRREVPTNALVPTGSRIVENLFTASDSPATQAITVVVGARYALYFRDGGGSGSYALTGAATETVAEGEAFTFTASTTTLTATLSGTPGASATVQLEENSGASVNAPSEYVAIGTVYNCVAAGIRSFADTNGNTFSAPGPGVVTEGTGTAINGIKGVLVEAAATNHILWSDDLSNAVWTKRGTASATKAVDGWSEVRDLTDLGTGVNDVFTTFIHPGSVGDRIEPSFDLRKVTASGTLNIRSAWGAFGSWDVDLSSVGTDPVRITRNHPAVTVLTEFVSSNPGNGGGILFSRSDVGSMDADIRYVQQEWSFVSTSPIPTTTAPATRNADVLNYTTGAAQGELSMVIEFELPGYDFTDDIRDNLRLFGSDDSRGYQYEIRTQGSGAWYISDAGAGAVAYYDITATDIIGDVAHKLGVSEGDLLQYSSFNGVTQSARALSLSHDHSNLLYRFGRWPGSGSVPSMYIRSIKIYDEPLTEAQLNARTS